jgi:hypothetical protein
LIKYWSLKNDEFQTNLHLILPSDILILSVHVLESQLGLIPVKDGDSYGEETDQHPLSLIGF